MSIRRKLYWGFGLILITVFVLFLVNMFAVLHEHSARDTAKKAVEMVQAMSKLEDVRQQNRLRLRNFLLNGDTKEFDALIEDEQRIDGFIANAEDKASALADAKNDNSARAKTLLEQVRDTEKEWLKTFATPLADKRRQVDAGTSTVAELQIAYLQADPQKWQVRETNPMKELESWVQDAMDSSQSSDKTASMLTLLVTVLGFLLVLGMGGVIAWKSAQSITEPLAQLIVVSGQIANSGDLDQKVEITSSDEVGELARTFNNMVESTQLQSSNVSETSASIDEMVASIQRVADTAKVLLDISQRSRDEVHSGITTMEKATDGLNRINSAISSSAEIISVLGQRADDIGKIIEVIDDLAEQTNLLALNAAIEAARAGEHGLGFAVVADEVRKLAEKSAQSTREISELIQSIQKEARKAVDNMEKSTSIVNEGISLGGDLSGALKKISSVVSEVYKFAQEIGAATNEQSHGSSQIAKATTRLNEITHEINSSVEEQASGAQAVVRAMEKMRELVQRSSSGSTELAASAEQMSKMSRSLLESMDRFVIESVNGNGHHRAKSNVNSRGDERKSLSRYATTTS